MFIRSVEYIPVQCGVIQHSALFQFLIIQCIQENQILEVRQLVCPFQPSVHADQIRFPEDFHRCLQIEHPRICKVPKTAGVLQQYTAEDHHGFRTAQQPVFRYRSLLSLDMVENLFCGILYRQRIDVPDHPVIRSFIPAEQLTGLRRIGNDQYSSFLCLQVKILLQPHPSILPGIPVPNGISLIIILYRLPFTRSCSGRY